MTEKDVVSKTLESYPDVFADIINGFLFSGKQLVSPDDLIPANIASQYKADNKMCPNESIIPINAEKINNGDAKLSYNQEFQFAKTDDNDICFNTVIDRYIKEINRVGIENCCILCPMKSRGKTA